MTTQPIMQEELIDLQRRFRDESTIRSRKIT